jgi:hypothetical protein
MDKSREVILLHLALRKHRIILARSKGLNLKPQQTVPGEDLPVFGAIIITI